MKKELIIYEGKRTFFCILAAVLYAVGLNLFVVPAGLYSGGVMGFCQVFRTVLADYLNIEFHSFDIAGVIYYIINIPLFVVAFARLGRKFFVKTLVTVTSMTVFLSLIPVTQVVKDTMASCMVGGIIAGCGIGVALRMGSCSGGMDVVALLLARWKRDFSVGKVGLMVNLLLYTICIFLFDMEIAVYSVIFAAVYSLAMDKVHTQNINVEANIITKADTTELEQAVFEEIGRGITKWQAQGAYTHEQSHILYVTLSKYEVSSLKTVVHKYDPHAFIVVNEGVSVDGNFLKKL
jgi:uncharacterized membrane-anchored protein YitT (DUF2179 family)